MQHFSTTTSIQLSSSQLVSISLVVTHQQPSLMSNSFFNQCFLSKFLLPEHIFIRCSRNVSAFSNAILDAIGAAVEGNFNRKTVMLLNIREYFWGVWGKNDQIFSIATGLYRYSGCHQLRFTNRNSDLCFGEKTWHAVTRFSHDHQIKIIPTITTMKATHLPRQLKE